MEVSEFQIFLQGLLRPINCLTDQDRNIRSQGLTTIFKECQRAPQHQIQLFATSNIGKNLIHTLGDPIENNREKTINIWENMIKSAGELHRDHVEPIIQALIARVNATPFPQKSEDLRERVLRLLKLCLPYRDSLVMNMGQLANALSKCLGDPSSIIKNQASDLVIDLSGTAKEVVGKYGGVLSKALGQNLKHNKFQVRKKTLLTISRLLITSDAGGNIQHLQPGLKGSLADPKGQVRKAALECVGYLLKYMAPKYLKQCQANLVSYLLLGLSDQKIQNIQLCKSLLDECGGSIKELYGEVEV